MFRPAGPLWVLSSTTTPHILHFMHLFWNRVLGGSELTGIPCNNRTFHSCRQGFLGGKRRSYKVKRRDHLMLALICGGLALCSETGCWGRDPGARPLLRLCVLLVKQNSSPCRFAGPHSVLGCPRGHPSLLSPSPHLPYFQSLHPESHPVN